MNLVPFMDFVVVPFTIGVLVWFVCLLVGFGPYLQLKVDLLIGFCVELQQLLVLRIQLIKLTLGLRQKYIK